MVIGVFLERFDSSFVPVEQAFTFARYVRNEDGRAVTHYACSYVAGTKRPHDGNRAKFQGIDDPIPSIYRGPFLLTTTNHLKQSDKYTRVYLSKIIVSLYSTNY